LKFVSFIPDIAQKYTFFLSHAWGKDGDQSAHKIVKEIAERLLRKSIDGNQVTCFVDENDLRGNMKRVLSEAILDSEIFVAA
jgi:hypothetical protein